MLMYDRFDKFVKISPMLWIRTGFHADPDPAFYLEPDPGKQSNADPDPSQAVRRIGNEPRRMNV
jgi:hypothetical protein